MVNSDLMRINGRSLDTNLSKETLPENVYVVVYIPAYNLILYLRGNSQLFKSFKVILFHYKDILIKITFL